MRRGLKILSGLLVALAWWGAGSWAEALWLGALAGLFLTVSRRCDILALLAQTQATPGRPRVGRLTRRLTMGALALQADLRGRSLRARRRAGWLT